MQGFLAPIAVHRTGDYDKDGRAIWELTRPLFYYSASLKTWLVFPVRFKTNYASVPRMPLVYWYCGDRVYEEAAGHDFIYTVHGIWTVTIDNETGLITDEAVFRKLTRQEGDDLFLEMLLLNPTIPEGMAHTMHKAVSWFGQSSWDDETNIVQAPEILALEPPKCEPAWG